jgi:hypothetical protein
MNPIKKYALINAGVTALYIVGLVTFIANMESVIEESFLVPALMLILFVFSAAFTAAMILGRPILWYLDGKKKEAVSLFIWTLGCFFVMGLALFVIIATGSADGAEVRNGIQ